MLEDSAPKKSVYREHTRVKHVLLEKYLKAWIPVLGKYHSRICYFDGFAGRGEYESGDPGSPVIAIQVAHGFEKHFGEFVCTNIEHDPDAFKNLESTLSSYQYPKIKVVNVQGAFADVIEQIIVKVGGELAPSFFFIDPFGFSGVPFGIIKDILSIQRTEVFITFMYHDINRFLRTPQTQTALNALFGTTISGQLSSLLTSREKENAIRDLYVKQLREAAGARFVLTFRVSMQNRRRTRYYLIYATNHFKGLMLMKTIMYNQGVGGDFSYLGPEDGARRIQPSFFDDDVQPLKDLLLARFKGRTLTYNQIEEETWEEHFVDKHYRAVLKELENDEKVCIKHVSSKTTRGLSGKDQISFL
ncbi:MAG: three-Cys-motif partner protein TcmP [Chloroflexi bacterium]|nr:three-Cys-motif partner protein TcmP [Chloroflexota bacterium]